MLTKIVTISVGILVAQLVCVTADEPDHTRSVHLTPFPDDQATAPKQRQHDSWQFSLEPKEMARYNVTIADTDTSPEDRVYNLVRSSISVLVAPDYNQNILWAWQVTGEGESYVCDVVNTVWVSNDASVSIGCRWDAEIEGATGLRDAGIPIDPIYGSAYGLATHNQSDFEVSSSVEIDGAPEYLCINEVLDLYAWLVIGDFPFEDSQLVDADWSVESVGSDGGGGFFMEEMQASMATFVPTNEGLVKVTATVPDSSPLLTDSVEFTIVRVTIETESEPKDLICKGGTKTYTAEVLPPGVTGTFAWRVSDEENLDIVGANNQQTVTVTGRQASASASVEDAEELTVEFSVNGELICEPSTNLTVFELSFVDDDDSEYNFSPSLGEEAKLKVQIEPPIDLPVDDYYFEIRIVRKSKNENIQHLGYLDVSECSDFPYASKVDFGVRVFTWNGVVGGNHIAVYGDDEFEGDGETFYRFLPSIKAEDPVPPPLYTAIARIVKHNVPGVPVGGATICEAEQTIYVPQVVKLKYDADAIDLLRSPLYDKNDPEIILYEQMQPERWEDFKDEHLSITQSLFDDKVNIRIVGSETSVQGPYSIVKMETKYTNNPTNIFGRADGDFPNADPSDTASIYVFSHRIDLQDTWTAQQGFEFDLPFEVQEIAHSFASTTAHEIGHLLGLVEINVLGGTDGGLFQYWHNDQPWTRGDLMNPMTQNFQGQTGWLGINRIGRAGEFQWKELNREYLEFILPK